MSVKCIFAHKRKPRGDQRDGEPDARPLRFSSQVIERRKKLLTDRLFQSPTLKNTMSAKCIFAQKRKPRGFQRDGENDHRRAEKDHRDGENP